MPNGPGIRPRPCHSVRRVDDELADRLAIRDVVETWAIARDSGDWEAFRNCWPATRSAPSEPGPRLGARPGRAVARGGEGAQRPRRTDQRAHPGQVAGRRAQR